VGHAGLREKKNKIGQGFHNGDRRRRGENDRNDQEGKSDIEWRIKDDFRTFRPRGAGPGRISIFHRQTRKKKKGSSPVMGEATKRIGQKKTPQAGSTKNGASRLNAGISGSLSLRLSAKTGAEKPIDRHEKTLE